MIKIQKSKGETYMEFSEKLIALRKGRELTQEQLAEQLNVSRHEPAIIRLNQEKPTKSRVCTDSVLFI